MFESYSYVRAEAKDMLPGDILTNYRGEECIIDHIECRSTNIILHTKEIITKKSYIMHLNYDIFYVIKAKVPKNIFSSYIFNVEEKSFLYSTPNPSIQCMGFVDESVNDARKISTIPTNIFCFEEIHKDEPYNTVPLRKRIPKGKRVVLYDGKQWSFL